MAHQFIYINIDELLVSHRHWRIPHIRNRWSRRTFRSHASFIILPRLRLLVPEQNTHTHTQTDRQERICFERVQSINTEHPLRVGERSTLRRWSWWINEWQRRNISTYIRRSHCSRPAPRIPTLPTTTSSSYGKRLLYVYIAVRFIQPHKILGHFDSSSLSHWLNVRTARLFRSLTRTHTPHFYEEHGAEKRLPIALRERFANVFSRPYFCSADFTAHLEIDQFYMRIGCECALLSRKRKQPLQQTT